MSNSDQSSIKQLFGVDKFIIGMAHCLPLPGSPLYDAAGGVAAIERGLRRDVEALQAGGVDAVMFCNEGDRPYRLQPGFETVAVMAAAITAVKPALHVPFGVDVLWSPKAALALATATGAAFVREIFTGVYAGDMGYWNTDCGEVFCYRNAIGAQGVKLFFNINAEFSAQLDTRPIGVIARSVVFSSLPDGLCISGPMTGQPTSPETLAEVKRAAPNTTIIANTGVNVKNVRELLAHADGAIVGTSLKMDGVTWNPVDAERVKAFMAEVRKLREGQR